MTEQQDTNSFVPIQDNNITSSSLDFNPSLTTSSSSSSDNTNNNTNNKLNDKKKLKNEIFMSNIKPPKDNQCNYLVKQKKRYCKRDKAPNSNYCHTHLLEQDNNNNSNNNNLNTINTNNNTNNTNNNINDTSNNKRVRCPIDPNHTVYENRLSKHIKICNKSIEQNKINSQPYFNKNIHYNYLYNMLNEENNNLNNNTDNNLNNNNNNLNENKIIYSTIGELFKNDSKYFYELIDKINNLYKKLNIETFIENNINENYKFISSNDEEFSEKHHKQHCSFIYNLNELNCLNNNLNYIEFGCGKGNLSYCVRRALIDHELNNLNENDNNNENNNIINNESNNQSNNELNNNDNNNNLNQSKKQTFILIDRENQRRKVDNFIKYGKKIQNNQQDHCVKECNVERILADIGDLDLSKINSINSIFKHYQQQELTENNLNNNTISISKHLCGIATDLTLICLKDLNDKLPNINKGIFIALCCHHKCTFKGYINKKYLIDNNITEYDFTYLKLFTSFATCQFSKLQNKNTSEEYNLNDKEEIGLKCKRILDFGRLEYLKNTNQYNYLKLIYYCNKNTSLENCMLIALNK